MLTGDPLSMLAQTVVGIEVSGRRPELALEDELPIVKFTPFEPVFNENALVRH